MPLDGQPEPADPRGRTGDADRAQRLPVVEAPEGVRFLIRSRLLTDEEVAELDAN